MGMSLDKDIYSLLEDVGDNLTLTIAATTGTYAPGGTVTGKTPANYTVKGKIIENKNRFEQGGSVVKGKRKALIAGRGLPVEPKIGDSVGGLGIIHVHKITENSSVVAYSCELAT